jgi:hypothetical protein
MTLRAQIIALATAAGHADLAAHMGGAAYNRANFVARLQWLKSLEAA